MKILILEGLHGNNKGKKCQWRLKRTNLKVGNLVTLDCHDWKIIEVIGESKEVKKMSRPYFETEVVKVKKEKKSICPDSGRAICLTCGKKLYHIEKPKEEKKGNWVNGENLDKIKFPCFCSYIERITGKKRYGKIDKNWDDLAYKNIYQMSEVYKQSDGISVLYENLSLKKLMENLNIHILKGKIIIYEEE